MDSPDDLNTTDERILDLLREGRETRGSIATQLGKHENYIGERLKWLRVHNVVQYHHKETGLYELIEDPREQG
jgi:predicted ArsR family transcriptional regulator